MRSVDYSYGYDPFIPTEETMFKRLEESAEIDDSWVLHKLPLANMINKIGAPATQRVINQFNPEEKKIFVCQHILVDQLKVDKNSLMCSPHASNFNGVIPIPHYPVNASQQPCPRNKLFGFLGSTSTHHTRKGIVTLFPDSCKDSGVHWGLDINLGEDFSSAFTNELANCHFALCPRGTGISSVRMFEAMTMGTIPVIIADGYKPPLKSVIEWEEISIHVPEKKIRHIPKILGDFSLEDIENMRIKLQQFYTDYLSPENFHKSVEITINELL